MPASTGKAAITIYPAGQITYADGHTTPAARPAVGDTSQPAAGLTSRDQDENAPGPWTRRQPRSDIRAAAMPLATAKHPGDLKQA